MSVAPADKELFEKRVGTTLRNKWTLERLLGAGGMAAVYVAAHKIGRREAIKILHPDAARSDEMRARFEQEALAANKLGHPGVVEIRDVDTTEDGSPFLVMELLEGEPLSERAKRLGHLELQELFRYMDELLDVLAAAHAQGIVHRDIKPDNIFICSDGRLKVLDFGIAHMRTASAVPKTRMGVILGTTTYMPPEQVKGMRVDGRADLFAVGATMFRLISKRRIHDAATETELTLVMATTPAPALESVVPGAPKDVCLVVDRALAFDMRRRYPDAQTMQNDVRALREGRRPPFALARWEAGDRPGDPMPPEAEKSNESNQADILKSLSDLGGEIQSNDGGPSTLGPSERTSVAGPKRRNNVATTVKMDNPSDDILSRPQGALQTISDTAPDSDTPSSDQGLNRPGLIMLMIGASILIAVGVAVGLWLFVH